MAKQRKKERHGMENLKPFKKGESGNPNGRPKKIYTILKDKGYNHDDIKTAFREMAFYTVAELNEAYQDESKPVITRIIANQFFRALKNDDWTKIKEIMEHVIGKPNQPFSGDVRTRNMDFYDLMIMAEEDDE